MSDTTEEDSVTKVDLIKIVHSMIDKLEAIKARFDQLGVALTNPEIVNDNKKFVATSKEYRSLEKIVNAYSDYRKVLDDTEFYKEALNGDDEEMRELAKEETPRLEERKQKLESYISVDNFFKAAI